MGSAQEGLRTAAYADGSTHQPSHPEGGFLSKLGIIPDEWWKEYHLPDLFPKLDEAYQKLYVKLAVDAMSHPGDSDLRLPISPELLEVFNQTLQAWKEQRTEPDVVINGIVHPAARVFRSDGFRVAAAPIASETGSLIVYAGAYLHAQEIPFAPSPHMRRGLIVGALNAQARTHIPPQEGIQFRGYDFQEAQRPH